jgi:hypothetical protein
MQFLAVLESRVFVSRRCAIGRAAGVRRDDWRDGFDEHRRSPRDEDVPTRADADAAAEGEAAEYRGIYPNTPMLAPFTSAAMAR